MYRVDGGRVALDLGGPSVEVERIVAFPIYWAGVRLTAAFDTDASPERQSAALEALYGFVVAEGQPTWDLADARGPIPATAAGMLRLPVMEIAMKIVLGWLDTYRVGEPSTAADELLPEGALRDSINAELRKKRRRG
jgi:hypothetical protein